MKRLILAAILNLPAGPALAALTGTGVQTLNATGTPSTNFGSNETITFLQRINNSALSAGRIVFKFQIMSPLGGQAMLQQGNAVPGTPGNSQSELSGLPITTFFNVPGTYTLNASATLGGQTITQTARFTITSPSIVLTYPPNGAQNLTDNPLTFRWVSNGGATYRVTVGDNPSFYNSLFNQTTPVGQGFLTYPSNPTDVRQRLTTGQVYYWKVDSLDGNGNIIATSQPPFTFTVSNTALTRDLAVVGLTQNGAADGQGNLPFQVTVKDQGSTTETNVPLAFSLGGISASGSPTNIATIGPGASLSFNFSAMPIPGAPQSLAVACLQFFDDVMSNNCMSLNLSPYSGSGAGSGASGPGSGSCALPASPTQIWSQIQSILQAQGYDLTTYQLTTMEGSMSSCELLALLNELKQGTVQISLSGPVSGGGGIPVTANPAPVFVQPSTGPALALEGQEWTGMTQPLSHTLRTFTIVEDDVWQKLWPHFDGANPVPQVDFGRYSVVGLIGGRFDAVSDIRIQDVALGRKGLRVRYAVSGEKELQSSAADGRSAVPYILRIAPRAGKQAQFEELKDKERTQ